MHDTPPPRLQPVDAMSLATPVVVLDTNVALDWLLFRDAGCAHLATQLQAGQLQWQATLAMRNELSSVLPRPEFRAWLPDCEHILSTFDSWARIVQKPPCAARPDARLRCRDPDDQKFIDLAVAVGAKWLFSKDRALLALLRPARTHGVEVLTPARWQQQVVARPATR
jgi:uncharacterized protein